jgi:hypothetical protein
MFAWTVLQLMRFTSRTSVLLIALGQIAALVSAPIAVCCLTESESARAHECPHQMELGAFCPMHQAQDNALTSESAIAWRSCQPDGQPLAWLYAPVAPPEPLAPSIGAPVTWTPFAVPALIALAHQTAAPPSPPPRAA